MTWLSEAACTPCLHSMLQALAQTSAASGSGFGRTAAAAAANVTNALGLVLKHRLSLRCTPDAANPGALCYDGVFGMVTTARALQVSRRQQLVIWNGGLGLLTSSVVHCTKQWLFRGPAVICQIIIHHLV